VTYGEIEEVMPGVTAQEIVTIEEIPLEEELAKADA